jgi:hypothetical protein
MALQHLRSSTANKRPTPAGMSDGQLAMNTNSGSPGLFLKDSSDALVKVGPVHVGTTAPNASPASGGQSGNTVGEQWLDTSGSTYVFKIWDGSAWRSEAGEFVNVTGDVMTGALGIIAGSAGSPGLYFSGDTNTGIYSPGADQVSVATGGTERLRIDAAGQIEANGLGSAAAPAYSWIGDPNTGIYSPGADQVAISTNGSGRLFITDTRLRLNVNSQFHISNNTDASSGLQFIGSDSAESTIGTMGNHALIFRTNSAERMRLTSTGALGLGTSSPQTLLHLLNTDTTTGAVVRLQGGSSVVSGGRLGDIDFWGGRASSNVGTTLGRIRLGNEFANTWDGNTSREDTYLAFSTAQDQTLNEQVRINCAGNVGIGTTSPSEPLHVIKSGSSGGLRVENTTNALRSTAIFVAPDSGGVARTLTVGAYSDGSPVAQQVIASDQLNLIAGTSSALTFRADGSERARIDSSGRLLVGTSSSLGNNATLQTAGQQVNYQAFYSATAQAGPFVILSKSRGTQASPTIVTNNDYLGIIGFSGYDGTDYATRGAEIAAMVDGTPGADDLPTRLVFSTTADGANSPTEQLRITSDRYIRLASGTGGIQFGGDTAAANALDDYEEGTFTPTIVGTSTAGTATYAANGQVGRYTKIGNRVFFDLFLSWTAHTGTGDLQINGLPFTVQNTTNLNRNYSAILNVVAMTAGNLGAAFSSPNTTQVALRQMPTGGGSVATIPMDTSAQISISGCFEA